jgi:hypothetical protein
VPIEIKCQCGKVLKAPDSMAGKRAKCPACGTVLVVPAAEEEILEAEEIAPPVDDDPYGLRGALDEEAAYQLANPQPAKQTPSSEDRRPCPACGEMIPVAAAKCRFCNEVFDSRLKKKTKKSRSGDSSDDDLGTTDWVLCVLCGGIACIMGIVYMIQGKPKGIKMIGVSIGIGVLWNILGAVIREMGKH